MNRTNSKKALASTLALAILVTGTFAWQSFSQEATNEIIESVDTPGGRLHDYFNGSDKDVFVENYASGDNAPDVYARIRIREYFEFGKNAGTSDATSPTILAGDISSGSTAVLGNTDTWDIYDYKATTDSDIREYRDLDLGGSTVYLPTFNDNNEDKTPEVNGTYRDASTGEVRDTPYEDYVEFTPGTSYDSYKEISSGDGTHTAKYTEEADVMTMSEWLLAGAPVGDTWVFDTDGWAYYAAPIAPGTASGLLINGISIDGNPSEEWYYAVDVEAQLATAGDWGKAEDTDVTSSMYASTMSEDGLYVLNKAAGIATVEGMTITNDGAELKAGHLVLSGTPITFDVNMDVVNGTVNASSEAKAAEVGITWTVAEEGVEATAISLSDTLVQSGNKIIFTATSDMILSKKSYVITATSDLDPSKSVSITLNPKDYLSDYMDKQTVIDAVGTANTIEIDGIEYYVIRREDKTNEVNQTFDGVLLMMKENLTNDGAGYLYATSAVDGYYLSSWLQSDLKKSMEAELAKLPILSKVAESVALEEPLVGSEEVAVSYDKLFVFTEEEFIEYGLESTEIGRNIGTQMIWIRRNEQNEYVYGMSVGENWVDKMMGILDSPYKLHARPVSWVAL